MFAQKNKQYSITIGEVCTSLAHNPCTKTKKFALKKTPKTRTPHLFSTNPALDCLQNHSSSYVLEFSANYSTNSKEKQLQDAPLAG